MSYGLALDKQLVGYSPGKSTSSILSFPVPCSFLCRFVALWTSPFPGLCVHWCHPCSAHSWQSYWWVFMGLVSDITKRQSQVELPDLLALTIFLLHFLQCFASLGYRRVLKIYLFGLGSTILYLTDCCFQMLSLSVTKRRLPVMEWRLHLSKGIRTNAYWLLLNVMLV